MTTPRLKLRSADRWDRPNSYRQSSGQFRASWTGIRDQLLFEAEQLDAKVVVVQLVIDPSGLRNDGKLRANAKVLHPGVKVSFESKHGPLTYATDQYERLWPNTLPGWQANLRAIGLGLQALRAVDRYGISRSGEQYRGWSAIASKPFGHGEMTVDEAINVLLHTTGADVTRDDLVAGDPKFVTAAYRSAARRWHPDTADGSDAVFAQITKARDTLLAR